MAAFPSPIMAQRYCAPQPYPLLIFPLMVLRSGLTVDTLARLVRIRAGHPDGRAPTRLNRKEAGSCTFA